MSSSKSKIRKSGRNAEISTLVYINLSKYIICPRGLVQFNRRLTTECPKSLGPLCIVTYYIKWVKTSWTYSIYDKTRLNEHTVE